MSPGGGLRRRLLLYFATRAWRPRTRPTGIGTVASALPCQPQAAPRRGR